MAKIRNQAFIPNRKITIDKIDIRKTNELLKYARSLNGRIKSYDQKKGRTA